MYELYRASCQDQPPCCSAYSLRQHMRSAGLTSRAFSVEDSLVQGWVFNPSSYPEELKTKEVFLWGSQKVLDKRNVVAYLVWHVDCVAVCWWELQHCCCSDTRPSLLKPLLST